MPFLSRKKKGESSDDSSSKADRGSRNKKMPLFRRQSEKGRNRQQNQELLAQQDPEPRFDLSSCELTEVPSGVFAICKVLQKQVLLLHDNWLHGLAGGGDLIDLKLLRVLDLHNNNLKVLPEDIGCLIHLQVLDVSGNALKTLPQSVENLQSLQTLNLRSNKLKQIPAPVLKLKSLRSLDISKNDVEELPVDLCRVRSLETLVLDLDKMKFPSQETCRKSTAAIMMFLCGQAELVYEHPSKYWLKVEANNKSLTSSASEGYLDMTQIESQMVKGVQAYQTVLDQKRKDAQELEKLFQAEEEAEAELAARAAEDYRRLLSSITQNQEQDFCDLEYLNNKKETEKEEFLKYLKEMESSASSLLTQLLDYNVKAQETEHLLELMEQERMKEENWFTVRWEEIQNLRKQEILDNMEQMLLEFDTMEAARTIVESDKDETRRDAFEQECLDVGQIETLIHDKHQEHKHLVAKLAQEDKLQKAAFEALMISQDTAHSRIRAQIALIEVELAQITSMEMDQRAQRMAHELNLMAEQRVALSAMLSQLLEEKDRRQIELRKRLVEMELQREEGVQDYWLVQYQRLLDWKPQSLIDRESQLEIAVKDILVSAGAEDYLPLFARHRVTIKTLMSLTEADLQQMGVHELGLRKAILKQISKWQGVKGSTKGEVKDKFRMNLKEPGAASQDVSPTAPPLVHSGLPACLLERQLSVTARGVYSECAICLDRQSNIIFLTCGHVCCCYSCAQPIKECPLCRADISAKIKLCLPAQIQT